jgi:hypothetical protein
MPAQRSTLPGAPLPNPSLLRQLIFNCLSHSLPHPPSTRCKQPASLSLPYLVCSRGELTYIATWWRICLLPLLPFPPVIPVSVMQHNISQLWFCLWYLHKSIIHFLFITHPLSSLFNNMVHVFVIIVLFVYVQWALKIHAANQKFRRSLNLKFCRHRLHIIPSFSRGDPLRIVTGGL